MIANNRKLQFLFETKFSKDEKVPKTGRVLRNKIFVIGFPPNVGSYFSCQISLEWDCFPLVHGK